MDERHLFEDRLSGSRGDRAGLARALAFLRAGDCLVVWKLDRLGRSLPHLLTTVTGLKSRGVAFRSLTEQMDTTTPQGELLFHVFGALAQFERSLTQERVRAGLATACFTPQDDCASLLQQSIEMARTRIRVLAYELTDRSVINALIGAKRRGVDVQAVLDRVNQRGLNGREGSATILAAAGIPVWIDRPAGIEHNKTMVIDDDLVIGGSYNFIYSAQHRNAENMTLTRSPIVARWYLDY